MNLSPAQTTCSSLLHELQIIWDEIGEDDSERDKMLLQLEQECLDIYRRKVDKTRKYKAFLHQTLAESEAEISSLVSALGERLSFSRVKGTIKKQLSAARPILEDLRLKKDERMREINEIQTKIAQIRAEIAGNRDLTSSIKMLVNEHDLTLRKLGELNAHLQELQHEKSMRLQKVISHIHTIHQLSVVMSFDFFETVNAIHPSLTDNGGDQSKSISNDTLARLTSVINALKQEKQQRIGKLQNLGSKFIELWELMDTPPEEQEKFSHVTSLLSYSSDDEVSIQGYLALEVIEQAEVEVERLNILKASKMKELVLRRQNELEEIYRAVHMDVNSDSAKQTLISVIDSGDNIDLSDLLSSMDEQIAEAKQQALSRRDILDGVEKWQHAALEEKWLDDYEKDENRYSAGRGAHINLKRAEKARIIVGKIPSMVESLTSKTKAWETEKGISFLYNKVPLLGMLEEYTSQRKEREGEKRKYREQKKLHDQLVGAEYARMGAGVKKPLGPSANGNNMPGTPMRRTPGRHLFSGGKKQESSKKVVVRGATPVNYVALQKDDPPDSFSSSSRGK